MSILTRIKNNQVTDNTIEYQKLKDGTLVGTKFNANITLNSNVVILGNLTVANSYAQLNSVNTYINDPLVVFNNNYTSTPAYDIGMLVNRNLDSLPPYGAVNAAFVWQEASDGFVAVMTTETGTTAGAINNSGWANLRVGNLTAVTGNITGSFTTSGAVTLNTLTVPGQSTFNGNVLATNTVYITNTTASTQYTNGALVVTGGVGIGGNLNVLGNISTATGNIITTSSGVFYGNSSTGFGAIYAGIPAGYTFLPQTVAQFSSNINSYGQVNAQNINSGSAASTDFVATANNGTDDTHYVAFGINSSTYNESEYSAQGPNDSFLYADGNVAEPGGNLIISAKTVNRNIIFTTGGTQTGNIVARLNQPSTQSTSSTTGSFVVTGGVGISANLNVGGNAVIQGNLTVQGDITSLNVSTLEVEDLNITVAKGAVSAAAANGAGLTVDGASATLLYTSATDSWNVNKQFIGLGAEFSNTTPSTNTTSGALVVTGGVGIGGTLNGGNAVFKAINNTPIGNTTPSSATFTTAVTTGVLTSAGNIVGNSQTASSGTTTGALVLTGTGGAGIGGQIWTGDKITAGGNIVAASGTNSSSIDTGALIVQGGAGIYSNVFVGGASTFNSNMTAGFDTIIKGNNDETLIWARAGTVYDQVLIGNSATAGTLVRGAKLYINSTDSLRLPSGTTAQRPSSTGGTDVTGMFRYNTTVSALEVYDGAEWDAITTQFTVITAETFTGDDTTTVFTMANSATTASTFVAINGIIQQPTTSYSVSGVTLTFTEAPATGDVIDVRRLLTTQTVSGIASTNGYMQFLVDNNGAYVYTGTNSTAATTYWEPGGAQVESSANVSASYSNAKAVLDTFFANTYRTAIYEVQLTSDGNRYQSQSVTVIHDSGNVTYAVHGVVQTNGNCGLIEANIGSGKVNLLLSPAFNSNDIRIKKDYILI